MDFRQSHRVVVGEKTDILKKKKLIRRTRSFFLLSPSLDFSLKFKQGLVATNEKHFLALDQACICTLSFRMWADD